MSAPNRYVPPRVAPPAPSREVADLLHRAAEARAAGYEDLAATLDEQAAWIKERDERRFYERTGFRRVTR